MKITWDEPEARTVEGGVDHGVLYPRDAYGEYPKGVPWNGLTAVTDSPEGAEPNIQYADNIPYITLMSAETCKGSIEALTYPNEWMSCDGSAEPAEGLYIGQQTRQGFGLCYRTKIGNAISGMDLGYKLHLIYNGLASPSERANATVNDSPEALAFSWNFSTTPVPVTGHKDSATVTLDSTKIDPTKMAAIELILFGAPGVDPRLPMPDELIALIGSAIVVTPGVPTYNAATHTITIPTTVGVNYRVDGETVTGSVVLTAGEQVIVSAVPQNGYYFPANTDNDWQFNY